MASPRELISPRTPLQPVIGRSQDSHRSVASPSVPQSRGQIKTAQAALRGANTQALDNHTARKRLADARKAFREFLVDSNAARHFLSVTQRAYPLRRSDNGAVTQKVLKRLRSEYKWNSLQGRWSRKDGRPLVIENEIYDTILSYQRTIGINSCEYLWTHLFRDVEGVNNRDARHATYIWADYRLGELDPDDDTLWGRKPAVLSLPRQRVPDTDDPEPASFQTPRPKTTPSLPVTHKAQPITSSKRIFHPTKKNTLHVGTRTSDGTDVWLAISEYINCGKRTYLTTFYDHAGAIQEEQRLGVRWHDEFRYNRFPARADDKEFQIRAQRDYIHSIIKVHSGSVASPVGTKGQTTPRPRSRVEQQSNRYDTPGTPISNPLGTKRRRDPPIKSATIPTTDSSDSTDEDVQVRQRKKVNRVTSSTESSPKTTSQPNGAVTNTLTNAHNFRSPEVNGTLRRQTINNQDADFSYPGVTAFGGLSQPMVLGTTLLVSASNQPDLAPTHIPLEDCPNQAQLFIILASECGLQSMTPREVHAISATCPWDQKRQRIRKDHERDWTVLIDTIRKAWDKHGRTFETDGCEINMMVHVIE